MNEKLFEDVEKNTRLLRELTAIIFKWADNSNKRGDIITRLDNISGYNILEKNNQSNDLFSQHKQNLEKMIIQTYFDKNFSKHDPWYVKITQKSPNPEKALLFGYYDSATNRIALFYHDAQSAAGAGVFQKKKATVDGFFKNAIAHEMRHFFQYSAYPEYFGSQQVRATVYRKRPTEIDAVFYQILSNTDPTVHIGNPETYVKTVIDLLVRERDLSEKQLEQYKRQAAKYYKKHIDENLLRIWKQAIANNNRYLVARYPRDMFVSNVMDELEKYVSTVHFREMHDPVYMDYKKKTVQYWEQKTQKTREKQKLSSLNAKVYPILQTQLANVMPEITNSRISQDMILKNLLKNIRNLATARGINTNTKAYETLEQTMKARAEQTIKQYRG